MSDWCLTSAISSCIIADCDRIPFAGVEKKAYIMNKADIESYTGSGTEKTAINLKTGAKVYCINQLAKKSYEGTNTELAEGSIYNSFTNNFAFSVFENNSNGATLLNSLANGKFVVVFANEYDGSTPADASTSTPAYAGKYQIMGDAKGLQATAITRDPNSDETNGCWQVTLQEVGNPNAAVFLTQDGFDALVEDAASCCE